MPVVNTKIYENYTKVDLLNSTLLFVDSGKPENLAAYIRKTREDKGFTVEEVAERSRGGISQAYVNKIENGGVKNVSPEKLSALAKGLSISEEEMFAIVRGRNVNEVDRFTDFFGEGEELTEHERAVVLAVARAAIQQQLKNKKPDVQVVGRQAGKSVKLALPQILEETDANAAEIPATSLPKRKKRAS